MATLPARITTNLDNLNHKLQMKKITVALSVCEYRCASAFAGAIQTARQI